MSSKRIYKGIKKYYKNNTVIPEAKTEEVNTDEPVYYEPGLIKYRYFDGVEINNNGKKENKIVNYGREFYFGQFISLEELINKNGNGQYDTLIWTINQVNARGIAISPEGCQSIVSKNSYVLDPNEMTEEKLHSKSKIKVLY